MSTASRLHRRIVIGVSLVILLTLSSQLPAYSDVEETYVPGEILITVKAGVEPAAALEQSKIPALSVEKVLPIKPAIKKYESKLKESAIQTEGLSDDQVFQKVLPLMGKSENFLHRIYRIKLSGWTTVEEALSKSRENPHVEHVQPNYIYKTCMVPDDPYWSTSGTWGQVYDDLWGLKGQTVLYPHRGKIYCEEAWDINCGITDTGERIIVAVIDSGVDYNHPDFSDKINGTMVRTQFWENPNEIPDDGIDNDGNGLIDDVFGADYVNNDGDPMDDKGHGTHVAGIIAAAMNNVDISDNNIGIVGVAPFTKIMILKNTPQSGTIITTNSIKCINYAVDHGAKVLNCSWGGDTPFDLNLYQAFQNAHDTGCVSVVAAMNDNSRITSQIPASFDNVIAVASTDKDDIRSSFSNFGINVSVSAPGGSGASTDKLGPGYDVLSLKATQIISDWESLVIPGSNYLRLRGTSMACPHVSGLAAILIAEYPTESPDAIRARIMAGADPIYDVNSEFVGLLGSGRINANTSLNTIPQPWVKITDISPTYVYPGWTGSFTVTLKNYWIGATTATITLDTDDLSITINNGTVTFPSGIPSGGVVEASFNISVNATAEGTIPFKLYINYGGGIFQYPVPEFGMDAVAFIDVKSDTGIFESEFKSYLLETNASLQDYDGDGYPDLFGNNGLIYKNDADESFSLVYGIPSPNEYIVFDMDNDGDKDVFIAQGSTNSVLYENTGNGQLSNVTSSNIPKNKCNSCIPIDYDNDGFIDLWGSDKTTKTLFLLKNDGSGKFLNNVIGNTGIPSNQYVPMTSKIGCFDYDDDGDQDILLPSLNSSFVYKTILYQNEGNGTFTDVTQIAFNGQVGEIHYASPNDIAIGDYDNDGDLDIYFADYFEKMPTLFGYRWIAQQTGVLFENMNGVFSDVTNQAGYVGSSISHYWGGTDFFDFDNDGDLDLHITRMGGIYKINTLWENENSVFTNVYLQAFGLRSFKAYAAPVAIADYNNDGALDLYVASDETKPSHEGAFLENIKGTQKNWLKIKLLGVKTNRDGYGTRVYVTTGTLTQTREVHHSSVEALPLHFGLGDATIIDSIEVRWPSGKVQMLSNIPINQVLTITELLPFIESLAPTSGTAGTTVTLTGQQFGTGYTATGYDPDADCDHDGDVDAADQTILNAAYGSQVGDPNYDPNADCNHDGSVDVGDLGILAGAFGTDRGTKYVLFPGGMTAEIVSWSDMQIVCTVPYFAATGKITVTNENGVGNGKPFTITQ